jgi:hypothetical protein
MNKGMNMTTINYDINDQIEELARNLTPLSEIIKTLNITESYITEFLYDFFADTTFFDPEFDTVETEIQQIIDFYKLDQYNPN